jgi:beta-lactamase superfamily II metal-dependent hydrolase
MSRSPEAEPRPEISSEGLPEAIILDVGHGNAAVFLDGRRALVVDAGPGDLVASTLADHDVTEIAALVISHRHHDHTSELPSLLSSPDLRVRRLFINSDPNRDPTTRFERDLRAGFNSSRSRSATELQQVNETLGVYMRTDRLQVEVLAPSADLALGGVGAPTAVGGTVGAHTMSVMLRVSLPGGRSVVLCADQEYAGFKKLFDRENDLCADILVYPHHGGLTGASDEEAFARELARAMQPELVIFSHGRTKHRNPRPEVVRGVRSAGLSRPVRVICTQLSVNCSGVALSADERLNSSLRSRGAGTGHSCSGSLRLPLDVAQPLLPFGAAHLRFVLERVESGMCVARVQ